MKKRKKTSPTPAAEGGIENSVTTDTAGGSTPSGIFAMAAECTVADADSLKSGLAKYLERPETVTVDISAIRRIDTAGLQVIAAFVRDRESNGRTTHWQGTAQALSAAADLLGLNSLLKLPAPAAASV